MSPEPTDPTIDTTPVQDQATMNNPPVDSDEATEAQMAELKSLDKEIAHKQAELDLLKTRNHNIKAARGEVVNALEKFSTEMFEISHEREKSDKNNKAEAQKEWNWMDSVKDNLRNIKRDPETIALLFTELGEIRSSIEATEANLTSSLQREVDLVKATIQSLIDAKAKFDREDSSMDSQIMDDLIASINSKYGPDSEHGQVLSNGIARLQNMGDNLAANIGALGKLGGFGRLVAQDDISDGDNARSSNNTSGIASEEGEDDDELPGYDEKVTEGHPPTYNG